MDSSKTVNSDGNRLVPDLSFVCKSGSHPLTQNSVSARAGNGYFWFSAQYSNNLLRLRWHLCLCRLIVPVTALKVVGRFTKVVQISNSLFVSSLPNIVSFTYFRFNLSPDPTQ